MFISDRIKQKMSEHSITNSDIAKATGKSTAAVSKWVSGLNTPKGDSVFAIALALKCDAQWLLTGEQPTRQGMTKVGVWDENTPLSDDEFEVPYLKGFLVSCGDGYENGDNVEQRVLRFQKSTASQAGVDQKHARAIKASGESMLPIINDGATVFIDTSKTRIKDGKMFAVSYGGLFKIKYLFALSFGGVRLRSANPDFEDEDFDAAKMEAENFKIEGQVFSVSTMIAL